MINRTAEYLKTKRLKVFSTCKHLIWEIERYHWAERRETVAGEAKHQPYKKDDHLMDCMRYIIAGRPTKAIKDENQKIQRGSVAWEMEQEEAEAKDWRKKYA